ncbi:hypothetical protein PDIG_83650 [Penicillium digitatum PHI26]|uniref:Uncharacterized protein n=2 Tax=Penicillium digitatum TaxID=36651 RepID=K9FWI2_PEND2|nr:hypothetical protein PDIP_89150 [Penicillium digitatum Pd1]EKV04056.1 hypothetical protein PDIP_89150 [Penicillium digitatum Pd1]EKV05386.1 hypothetical protein PDIG_83650 [Penicillium digitatum PHI26]
MVSTPRMRHNVSSLILGNVQSFWNHEMLQENQIKAIVSLADDRWVWWNSISRRAVLEHHPGSVQTRQHKTFLSIKVMPANLSTKWHPRFFPH